MSEPSIFTNNRGGDAQVLGYRQTWFPYTCLIGRTMYARSKEVTA